MVDMHCHHLRCHFHEMVGMYCHHWQRQVHEADDMYCHHWHWHFCEGAIQHSSFPG